MGQGSSGRCNRRYAASPGITASARGHLPGWQMVRQKIFIPTGRLTPPWTAVSAWMGDRGRSGTARLAVWRIGCRSCCGKLQVRALEAGHRQRQRDQDVQREQIRQQEAEAVATVAFHEAHRASVLARQVQQWKSALDLDAYLAAPSGVVAGITDQRTRQEAQAWLVWGRRHRDLTDPLRQLITMPPLPDPTPADLAPYLPRNPGNSTARTLRRR